MSSQSQAIIPMAHMPPRHGRAIITWMCDAVATLAIFYAAHSAAAAEAVVAQADAPPPAAALQDP